MTSLGKLLGDYADLMWMNVSPLVPSVGVSDVAQQMAAKSATQTPASQVAPNNPQALLPDLKAGNVAPAEQVVSDLKPLAVPVVDAIQRLVGANLTKN